MRRPKFALTSALAAVGLSAGLAAAQQQPSSAAGQSSSSSADGADPSMALRPARYLLRNGMDYLAYREYDRALNFFRTLETRQGELNDSERQQLKKGVARAQAGKREASNSPRVVAIRKGRSATPPGAFALAKTPAPAPASAPEPVRLTGGEPEPAPGSPAATAATVELASLPSASAPAEPAPLMPDPSAPAPAPAPADLELPALPTSNLPTLPELSAPPMPTADPATAPASAAAPAPAPLTPEPAAPAVDSPPALDLPTLDLPTLPGPPPAVEPAPAPPVEVPVVAQGLPGLPPPAELAPAGPVAPEPAPAPEVAPAPSEAPARLVLPRAPSPVETRPLGRRSAAIPIVDPAPDPDPGQGNQSPTVSDLTPAGAGRDLSGSLLSPGHREEVDRIAQRPSDVLSGERGTPGTPGPDDPNGLGAPSQGSTRLELPRAPSPTEARQIRAIPVPEEFVPLKKREWDPNRKFWAAAGSCHMTLYFQDPVLERYGQGVEQALGPAGRFFSDPLDDPKQSNQRNQILQPFYSIGKFCFQVGTLPYKVLMDPPTEAEYDLGYYRPGDQIPPDTIMITPTGVGPPLKGRRY